MFKARIANSGIFILVFAALAVILPHVSSSESAGLRVFAGIIFLIAALVLAIIGGGWDSYGKTIKVSELPGGISLVVATTVPSHNLIKIYRSDVPSDERFVSVNSTSQFHTGMIFRRTNFSKEQMEILNPKIFFTEGKIVLQIKS